MKRGLLQNPKYKKNIVFLIPLIIFGLIIRIYHLGTQSFWIDEAYSVTAALGMMEHLLPYMPSGELYSRAILNTGLIALSMKVFGISEFSARLPSMLFGSLTIVMAYLLSKRLFGERVAFITAFIVTFSVVEIAWSRQARMYQQLQFFYILSLYLFYRYMEDRELKFLVLTFFSVLCTILTHNLGLSLLLVIPLYVILVNIRDLTKDPSLLKEAILRKGALTIIFLFIISFTISEIYLNAFTHILTTHVDYSSNYLWYLKTFFPIIFYISIPGIVISFKERGKETFLPLLAVLLPLYFIFFHEKLLGYRYIFLTLPLIFVFFAITIEYISRIITRNRIMQSILIILLIVPLFFTASLNAIPQDIYYLEPMAPQPNFISAYRYLQEDREEGDILIVSYPEIALWFNQTPDYWMAFSISGFSPSKHMDEDQTHYKRTMTPAIKNLEELEEVFEDNTRGYIVLDTLSGSRLPPSYWSFLINNTEWLSNPSEPGEAGSVNIYFWDKGKMK